MALFSKKGLTNLFEKIEVYQREKHTSISDNSQRIIALKDEYIPTIDAVILFLQGKNLGLV